MKLSIITVSHNSERHLPRFVDTFLRSHSGREASIEFVVVENSGRSATKACLEPLSGAGFDVTFAMMENHGFGAGCNRGASLACGDVLVFANPDLEFDTPIDAVAMFAGTWGTVTQTGGDGRGHSFDVLPEHKSVSGEFLGRYRNMTPPPATHLATLVPIGSFFCIDRRLFEQVGGFDERFFLYHEEAELSRRLHRVVGPPAFLPEVRVLHHAFGSQVSTAATFGHEADGLVTYASVTGATRAIRTRVIFLLLTAPISAVSRLRLRQLWAAWRKARRRSGHDHD